MLAVWYSLVVSGVKTQFGRKDDTIEKTKSNINEIAGRALVSIMNYSFNYYNSMLSGPTPILESTKIIN